MTKSTERPRRINEARLPIWSALSLLAAFSFASFVGGYIAGYHVSGGHAAADDSRGPQNRPFGEGDNSAKAKINRISGDVALKNIALIQYQWADRISGISSSDLDPAYVKDVLYAIWLSGYECKYITSLEYTATDTIRDSISRQMDNPQLATIVGLAGQQLGAAKAEKLNNFIEQGNEDLARRFLLDQLTPLLQAGGRDIATLDGRGAAVTCGESKYRVSTSLGSGGILVAAPL
jgi:hypothetical protein